MTGARLGGAAPPDQAGGHVRAAIFDCDGLLVDSSAAWRYAFACGAAELDRVLSAKQLRALLGSSVETAATQVATWAGRPDQAGAVRRRIHGALRIGADARRARPLPGAAALLGTLSLRLPMAVASNAPADVLASLLAGSGLAGAFNAVISAQDVPAPKPAPDVYLAACAALDVPAACAVGLEDSRPGAAAALAAGLSLIVATSQDWPHRTPLEWPGRNRSILFVTALSDPAVIAYLLGSHARERPW